MKKYIFFGGLFGFILAIATLRIDLPVLEYLSLTFLTNQIFSYLSPYDDTGMIINDTIMIIDTAFIILIPTIVYACIGYIVGHLTHKKSHIS